MFTAVKYQYPLQKRRVSTNFPRSFIYVFLLAAETSLRHESFSTVSKSQGFRCLYQMTIVADSFLSEKVLNRTRNETVDTRRES